MKSIIFGSDGNEEVGNWSWYCESDTKQMAKCQSKRITTGQIIYIVCSGFMISYFVFTNDFIGRHCYTTFDHLARVVELANAEHETRDDDYPRLYDVYK